MRRHFAIRAARADSAYTFAKGLRDVEDVRTGLDGSVGLLDPPSVLATASGARVTLGFRVDTNTAAAYITNHR